MPEIRVKQDEQGRMWVNVKRDNKMVWIKATMVNAPPDGSIVHQTMPDEQGYNGWTNYETWAVNLHLTNDQGLYHYVMMFNSADSLKQAITDKWYDAYDYLYDAALIRFGTMGERNRDRLLTLMYQDLLIASLQSVNWYEIYDGLHEEDESD